MPDENNIDEELDKILEEFGKGIDSQGYGGGDYDEAIKAIKSLFNF